MLWIHDVVASILIVIGSVFSSTFFIQNTIVQNYQTIATKTSAVASTQPSQTPTHAENPILQLSPSDCSKNDFSSDARVLSSADGNVVGYTGGGSTICITNNRSQQGKYYSFNDGRDNNVRAISRDGLRIYYMEYYGGSYEGHGNGPATSCDWCGLHSYDIEMATDTIIEKGSEAGEGIFWSDPYVDLVHGLYIMPTNIDYPDPDLNNALLILKLPSMQWEYLTYEQVNHLPVIRKFILPSGYVFDTDPGHKMHLDGNYLDYSALNPEDTLVNGRVDVLTGENTLTS
jgi:hypothetical protein